MSLVASWSQFCIGRHYMLLTLTKDNNGSKTLKKLDIWFFLNFQPQNIPLPSGLLWPQYRGRCMVKEQDFEAGKNRNTQIYNFVFMSYGHYWLFQCDPWWLPTQKRLKNATNDISIQEFHNIITHYKPHYLYLMHCLDTRLVKLSIWISQNLIRYVIYHMCLHVRLNQPNYLLPFTTRKINVLYFSTLHLSPTSPGFPPKNCTKKGMLFLASMGETGLTHDIFFCNSNLGLSRSLRPKEAA